MSPEILCLIIAGLITGFSKLSVGGMGLLILPVMMLYFPGPVVLGITIPLYVLTDIVAAAHYRKHIQWSVLSRLMPLTLVGVLGGSWLLAHLPPEGFKLLLGVMIVAMILLGVLLERCDTRLMCHPLSGHVAGTTVGFVSMTSNSAGPLVSLFMLEQNLSKEAYLSTRAWAFLMLNLIKLPFFFTLGLLNMETLQLTLWTLPGLALGALLGIKLLSKLEFKHIKWLVRGMATLAAIRLLSAS